jgi:hypothetical protein
MHLPKDDIQFIAQLIGDYIQNTADGKKTALKLLNATVRPADPRNAYFPQGRPDQIISKIPNKDLVSYAGWIYKGSMGLSLGQVEVERGGNLEACEDTGIMGPGDYCVKVVKHTGAGGRETLSSLSNYARMHSQDQQIRDSASATVCERCPLKTCAYHPLRESQQLKLIHTGTKTAGA